MPTRNKITIVVGTTLTGKSGGMTTFAREDLQGAYIAQKQHNDALRQSIPTEKQPRASLRILIANSGSQPEYAFQVAKQIAELAKEDKTIIGVMGWTVTAQAYQAIPPLRNAGIPIVSMASGNDLTTGIAKGYFFRIGMSGSLQGELGARYAINTMKAKRAVLFDDPGNDYIHSQTEGFKKSFTNKECSKEEEFNSSRDRCIVINEYTYEEDASNKAGHLRTGLQDALRYNPDIIYFSGYSADVSVLLREPLPSKLLVLGGDALFALDYPKDALLSHLRFVTLAYYDEWDIVGLSAQKPSFFKDYPDTFGGDKPSGIYGFTRATALTMAVYDATRALLLASELALEQKASITGNDVRDKLATLLFQGVTGQIRFDRNGEIPHRAATVICMGKDGFKMENMVIGQFLVGEQPRTGYPPTSACA